MKSNPQQNIHRAATITAVLVFVLICAAIIAIVQLSGCKKSGSVPAQFHESKTGYTGVTFIHSYDGYSTIGFINCAEGNKQWIFDSITVSKYSLTSTSAATTIEVKEGWSIPPGSGLNKCKTLCPYTCPSYVLTR